MDTLASVFEYFSFGIGLIAFLIIIWGVIQGIIVWIKAYLPRDSSEKPGLQSLGSVRYELGYHLLIALEFLIAADIIRTIVRPSLQELAILGSIVAIRVVLSYFLHREIGQKST